MIPGLALGHNISLTDDDDAEVTSIAEFRESIWIEVSQILYPLPSLSDLDTTWIDELSEPEINETKQKHLLRLVNSLTVFLHRFHRDQNPLWADLAMILWSRENLPPIRNVTRTFEQAFYDRQLHGSPAHRTKFLRQIAQDNLFVMMSAHIAYGRTLKDASEHAATWTDSFFQGTRTYNSSTLNKMFRDWRSGDGQLWWRQIRSDFEGIDSDQFEKNLQNLKNQLSNSPSIVKGLVGTRR